MTNIDNMTVLEKGRRFLDAYESPDYKTWQQVADDLWPDQTDGTASESRYNSVRGYASRARAERDERDMRQQRQVTIARNGGKPPRYDRTRVYLRSAVFDLETTDFNTASYKGFLICCCILPLDSDEVQTYQIEFGDPDDRRVLAEAIQALSAFDILIGHNISGFDLPWLASRVAYHNFPPFRRWYSIDTYQWSKRAKLRTRKKLSTLIDYFGVTGIKTAVEESSWNEIRSPFPSEFNAARDDIVYHCELDCFANRDVFDALYPRIMSTRYSSSSPISIFDAGMGAGAGEYADPERILKAYKPNGRALDEEEVA